MDQVLEKISKYNIDYIDYKNILWKDRDIIGKGIYRDNNIIIKIYSSIEYYELTNFYDDFVYELYNYSLTKDLFHCCYIYGYSYYIDENDNKEFYLLLKDYNIGDLKNYCREFIFWTTFKQQEININYYEFKYENYNIYTLERNEKILITKRIIDAIEELHNKNIVHCDLKLENMIYDSKEKLIKLIDFGCSCNLKNESYTYSDENMGTLGYMSPELSNGFITKRGDIYSLGVLILELWVGEIWKDGNEYDECYNEVKDSLLILRKKEKELSKIIKDCISYDYKKRPYIKTINKRINKIF